MTIIEKVKTVKKLSDLQQETVDMINELRHEIYGNNRVEFMLVFAELNKISQEIAVYGCEVMFVKRLGRKVLSAVQR